jgi:hypothetical protein
MYNADGGYGELYASELTWSCCINIRGASFICKKYNWNPAQPTIRRNGTPKIFVYKFLTKELFFLRLPTILRLSEMYLNNEAQAKLGNYAGSHWRCKLNQERAGLQAALYLWLI